MLPVYNNPEQFSNNEFLFRFLGRHFFYLALFYFNYFYFIPKILKQKGLGQYVFIVLAALIVVFLSGGIVEGWLFNSRQLSGPMFFSIIPLIQIYAVSTAFRLTLDYFNQTIIQKKLEEQNRLAQIRFLRSQINPHFLFNTLNNITALIRLRPDEAEKCIGTLSELMRYMLNSGTQEKTELSNEIKYIDNYINLQKLRLAKNFKINYMAKIEEGSVFIEPLLLVGFIENTFKHGVSGSEDDFIEITIESKINYLELRARNRIHQLNNIDSIVSGIGLENTKKRLQLCYKNNYTIELQTDCNIYDIKLRLNL